MANGVKYRREEERPEIRVTGRQAPHGYELRIADNGMGMSPEEAGRALEPFYRASRAQDVAGTGLGLSIVKRIVEAAGGTVAIESKRDEGTTFTLRLPTEPAPARSGSSTSRTAAR